MGGSLFIVGAGPGIGLHVAGAFGARGFRVALMARRRESLDACAAHLAGRGVEAHAIPADAADTASLEGAFREAEERMGPADVLVYNACFREPGRPSEVTADDLIRHYQVDVAGALRCVHLALPGMRARGRGTIILTGGGFALHPSPACACLSAHKAALRSLALMLHEDLRGEGIHVGTVTIMRRVRPGTACDPATVAGAFWRHHAERDAAEIVCG